MNLDTAQAFLLRDQRNWRKTHLSWLLVALYRYCGMSKATPQLRK